MILNIPYVYEETYLPTKRHKKPRTKKTEAFAKIDVSEVTEEDFPVAMIVHDYGSIYRGARSYQEILDRRTDDIGYEFKVYKEKLRTFNGKLYKPLRVSYGTAISTIVEPASRLKDILEDEWSWRYSEVEKANSEEIHLNDTKAEEETALQEKADKYVVFNRKVWVECGEPMYVIYTFGLGHNHGGTTLSIDYHYNDNLGKERYFTALQRIEAIDYGKKVAESRGDTKYISNIVKGKVKIDVLMPEMVKRNPSVDHGDGCSFMNMMESLVERSGSIGEAGLLVTALAMANT